MQLDWKILSVFLSLYLVLAATLRAAPVVPTAPATCPICGMTFKIESRTSYESVREGKPVIFCSFTCAVRFHKKFPKAHLVIRDFRTGNPGDAKSAFFLVKSKNISKEIEFGMPPNVVAFATERQANETRARLKDGNVVKGIDAAAKIYE